MLNIKKIVYKIVTFSLIKLSWGLQEKKTLSINRIYMQTATFIGEEVTVATPLLSSSSTNVLTPNHGYPATVALWPNFLMI